MVSRRLLGTGVLVLVAALAATLLAAVLHLTDSSGRAAGHGGTRDRAAGGPPRAAPLPGRVVDDLGVVSFNARRTLTPDQARRDWARLAGRPGVDLVGWQEAATPMFRDLASEYRARGWGTWQAPGTGAAAPLAVSWRRDTFALLGARTRMMHPGASAAVTAAPFPSRWVVTVRLRHRESGRTVSLLNTHVNQTIETGQRFERNLNARRAKRHYRTMARMWSRTPGDVVLGTGDYNFDHADDAAARPAGGLSRVFEGKAVSSYDSLGLDGVVPTRNTRWIDYVWLAADSVRRRTEDGFRGPAQLAAHRTLDGFESDHRPLLVRVRLYA